MIEKGKVIKKYGDFAEVIFSRKSACGENCANCSAMCREKKHIAKVKNTALAEVGDIVNVFTNDKSSYLALGLVFILPVIIFIFIYVLAFWLFKGHLSATVVSFVLLFIYFFILKRFEQKIAPIPEITDIIQSERMK